jgi:hypothetical protein
MHGRQQAWQQTAAGFRLQQTWQQTAASKTLHETLQQTAASIAQRAAGERWHALTLSLASTCGSRRR